LQSIGKSRPADRDCGKRHRHRRSHRPEQSLGGHRAQPDGRLDADTPGPEGAGCVLFQATWSRLIGTCFLWPTLPIVTRSLRYIALRPVNVSTGTKCVGVPWGSSVDAEHELHDPHWGAGPFDARRLLDTHRNTYDAATATTGRTTINCQSSCGIALA